MGQHEAGCGAQNIGEPGKEQKHNKWQTGHLLPRQTREMGKPSTTSERKGSDDKEVSGTNDRGARAKKVGGGQLFALLFALPPMTEGRASPFSAQRCFPNLLPPLSNARAMARMLVICFSPPLSPYAPLASPRWPILRRALHSGRREALTVIVSDTLLLLRPAGL